MRNDSGVQCGRALTTERTLTIGAPTKSRQEVIERLRAKGEVAVLVVGAGINGAAVFRELALNGFDALLIDKGDFGCGATAAPSRMIHAGLRYLEQGDYALVREGVHERNLLLQNCPHCVFPLPTTIPLQSRLDGLWGVIRKALHLGAGKRARRRGAWMVKLGLMLYDRYARHNRQMPKHHFSSRAEAFRRRPGLHPSTIMTATYYDAWISYPERLCLEVILDAEAACEGARALNYVSLQDASGGSVTLRDELTGQDFSVRPKAVVNAAGAWIDAANHRLGRESKLIAGTKGGHLVVENPGLFRALDGEMLFYETPEGRAVLAMPWLGKTLLGSTDIRIDDPDTAVCDEGEIDYMLGCLAHLFPGIRVDRSQIASTFSGVRPLRASDAATTGQMSRTHHCHVAPSTDAVPFPIFSMVGGKWTPFRAFGEQAMDKLLGYFGMPRKVSTEAMPIGGGKDFPRTPEAGQSWLRRLAEATGL
ncbi:MAG: glycerol-3-phosphate dehydrogenase/oxidase, partial [Planctomycetes bacterium]|nr:glycerol-3-phosphate dehydrogenase/oxidase [Planctomycetota bacterium]